MKHPLPASEDLRPQILAVARELGLLTQLTRELAKTAGPMPRFKPDQISIERLSRPGFKNLDAELLPHLRYCLGSGEFIDLAMRWAFELMRFCELNPTRLQAKALEKWPDKTYARLAMLQIGVLLLDAYEAKSDLRLLNTVLKLIELPWPLTPQTIARDLDREGPDMLAALFQYHILHGTEAALARLDQDTMQSGFEV